MPSSTERIFLHNPPRLRTINPIHSSSYSGSISSPPTRPQSTPSSFLAASLQPRNQLGTITSSRHGEILFPTIRHDRQQFFHPPLIKQRLNLLANPPPQPQPLPPSFPAATLQPSNQLRTITSSRHGDIQSAKDWGYYFHH